MSKKGNKILFFIITYHPNSQQLKNLLAVLKPYKTLVIDNTKNNLGYTGGANKAIQQGFKQNANWIVILNQDLALSPLFLQKFVSLLKNSNPGIFGPFAGSLDKKRWTTIFPSTEKNAQYISGSFIAIHKKVIEKIGDFYQPYFMYYEDADYCVRAQKSGFPIIPVKIPGISHHDAAPSFLHEYYLARNHLLFIKRNAPLLVKLHEFFRFPKTIYQHLKNKNQGALAGIKDFLIGKYGRY